MFETTTPQHNQILAALPPKVQDRLFPNLELVPLSLGKILCAPGDNLRHVYFPTDAIVSLIHETEDGASGEISIIGNEGLVGIALVMGGDSTSTQAIVHGAGSAYRLSKQQLKEEFDRHEEMLQLLLLYTQSLMTQMSQTAVCNRHHSVEQQLCRLLLLALDRVPGNQLTMTQELMASMLGVRREGVTQVATSLRTQNAIQYTRGKITVVDRSKLEQLSCECYEVVKKEYDRLLPGAPVLQIN